MGRFRARGRVPALEAVARDGAERGLRRRHQGRGPAGQEGGVVLPQRRALDAAARRATELGIEAYNILEGFEGDPDENGQRGQRGGWRFRGLPWRQG